MRAGELANRLLFHITMNKARRGDTGDTGDTGDSKIRARENRIGACYFRRMELRLWSILAKYVSKRWLSLLGCVNGRFKVLYHRVILPLTIITGIIDSPSSKKLSKNLDSSRREIIHPLLDKSVERCL